MLLASEDIKQKQNERWAQDDSLDLYFVSNFFLLKPISNLDRAMTRHSEAQRSYKGGTKAVMDKKVGSVSLEEDRMPVIEDTRVVSAPLEEDSMSVFKDKKVGSASLEEDRMSVIEDTRVVSAPLDKVNRSVGDSGHRQSSKNSCRADTQC